MTILDIFRHHNVMPISRGENTSLVIDMFLKKIWASGILSDNLPNP